MKKNYIILLWAILFSGLAIGQEIQKNFINYQGVARNAESQLMADEAMTIGIALKFGGSAAATAYEENHNLTTDSNGVFSLKIGSGNVVTGNYDTLPWGSAATFATVSINGSVIGTTEMMAVPYAVSSGDTQWIPNGNIIENKNAGAVNINEDLLVNGHLYLSQGAMVNEISADGTLADNSDAILPTQRAVKAYVDAQAGGGGGGADDQTAAEVPYDNSGSGLVATSAQAAIDELVSGSTVDADSDPNNEIQTLSFNSATNELSLTDGGAVTIPSGGTDADADPANEFQTLSFNAATNELSLTDGNTVTIPSGSTDADADPTNEIDVTTQTGILLGDGALVNGLEGTADGQVPKWDAGAGTWVAGTDATGGTGGSLWAENGGNIYYDGGDVGVGRTNPMAPLDVLGKNNWDPITTEGDLRIGNGTHRLKIGVALDGAGIGDARINAVGGTNRMILGGGTNDVLTVNDQDVGIGTIAPTAKLDVDGNIRSSDLSGTGTRNVAADANGNLIIAAGGGGSSLWTENGSDIHFDSGNVGIGNSNPGVEPNAGKYLTVATGTSPSDNAFASIEIQGGQGSVNSPVGRLDFISNSAPGNSAIGRVESRTSGGAQFKGDLAFSTKDGSNFAGSSLQERMTIRYNGNVGIGTMAPTTKLEVAGDIKLSGEVHTNATGTANMLAVAYGRISGGGSIIAGSGNFTLRRSSAGVYRIAISGMTIDRIRESTAVATRIDFTSPPGFIGTGSGIDGTGVAVLIINTYNLTGTREDAAFSFVVYGI